MAKFSKNMECTKLSRLYLAIFDVCSSVLQDLLYHWVHPAIVKHRIDICPEEDKIFAGIGPSEICCINKAALLGSYDGFDITLLYKVIRLNSLYNLRDELKKHVDPSCIQAAVQSSSALTVEHGTKITIDELKAVKFASKSNSYNCLEDELLWKLYKYLCPAPYPNIHPTKPWGDMPDVEHITVGDDVERIKVIRNGMYGPISTTEISEKDFSELWVSLEDIMVRMDKQISGKQYKIELDRIQKMCMDDSRQKPTLDEIETFISNEDKILQTDEQEQDVTDIKTDLDQLDVEFTEIQLLEDKPNEEIGTFLDTVKDFDGMAKPNELEFIDIQMKNEIKKTYESAQCPIIREHPQPFIVPEDVRLVNCQKRANSFQDIEYDFETRINVTDENSLICSSAVCSDIEEKKSLVEADKNNVTEYVNFFDFGKSENVPEDLRKDCEQSTMFREDCKDLKDYQKELVISYLMCNDILQQYPRAVNDNTLSEFNYRGLYKTSMINRELYKTSMTLKYSAVYFALQLIFCMVMIFVSDRSHGPLFETICLLMLTVIIRERPVQQNAGEVNAYTILNVQYKGLYMIMTFLTLNSYEVFLASEIIVCFVMNSDIDRENCPLVETVLMILYIYCNFLIQKYYLGKCFHTKNTSLKLNQKGHVKHIELNQICSAKEKGMLLCQACYTKEEDIFINQASLKRDYLGQDKEYCPYRHEEDAHEFDTRKQIQFHTESYSTASEEDVASGVDNHDDGFENEQLYDGQSQCSEEELPSIPLPKVEQEEQDEFSHCSGDTDEDVSSSHINIRRSVILVADEDCEDDRSDVDGEEIVLRSLPDFELRVPLTYDLNAKMEVDSDDEDNDYEEETALKTFMQDSCIPESDETYPKNCLTDQVDDDNEDAVNLRKERLDTPVLDLSEVRKYNNMQSHLQSTSGADASASASHLDMDSNTANVWQPVPVLRSSLLSVTELQIEKLNRFHKSDSFGIFSNSAVDLVHPRAPEGLGQICNPYRNNLDLADRMVEEYNSLNGQKVYDTQKKEGHEELFPYGSYSFYSSGLYSGPLSRFSASLSSVFSYCQESSFSASSQLTSSGSSLSSKSGREFDVFMKTYDNNVNTLFPCPPLFSNLDGKDELKNSENIEPRNYFGYEGLGKTKWSGSGKVKTPTLLKKTASRTQKKKLETKTHLIKYLTKKYFEKKQARQRKGDKSRRRKTLRYIRNLNKGLNCQIGNIEIEAWPLHRQQQSLGQQPSDSQQASGQLSHPSDGACEVDNPLAFVPSGSLSNYFLKLSEHQPLSPEEKMQYEWMRLQSFSHFPSNSGVSPLLLAKWGYYATGNGDEVVCYCCKHRYSNWKIGDNPKDIHKRHSPSCRFILGIDSGNAPIHGSSPANGLITSTQESRPSTRESQLQNGLPPSNASHGSISSQLPRSQLPTSRPATNATAFVQAPNSAISNRPSLANGVVESSQPSKISTATVENNISVPSDQLLSITLTTSTPNNASSQQPRGIFAQATHSTPSLTGGTAAPPVSTQSTNTRSTPANGRDSTPHQSSLASANQDTLGINFDKPKYPSYAVLAVRISSYSGWPSFLSQTPREMSLAGFFYAGYGDYVRCFFCGGGLRNWESGDDPWVEHARWFPRCAFVRQNRGDAFVDLVMRRHQELVAEQNASGGQVDNAPQTTVEEDMTTPAALSLIEMGFSTDVVRAAITEFRERKPNVRVIATELLEIVLELEERQRTTKQQQTPNSAPQQQASASASHPEESNKQTKSEPEKQTKSAKKNKKKGKVPEKQQKSKGKDNKTSDDQGKTSKQAEEKRAPVAGSANSPAPQRHDDLQSMRVNDTLDQMTLEEVKSLQEENAQLKEQTICKVCMDKNVSIAFLPCGHLACCEDCAPAMRTCPICREFVRGTVKTYLV